MHRSFDELKVFRFAVDLTVDIYDVTRSFPREELYGLTSQLRRAAVSVVSHIAEGQGRLTPGEWRQMLSQGRGSLYELQAQLIVAQRLRYLESAEHDVLRARTREIGKLLSGLIAYVRERERHKKTPHGRTTNQRPN